MAFAQTKVTQHNGVGHGLGESLLPPRATIETKMAPAPYVNKSLIGLAVLSTLALAAGVTGTTLGTINYRRAKAAGIAGPDASPISGFSEDQLIKPNEYTRVYKEGLASVNSIAGAFEVQNTLSVNNGYNHNRPSTFCDLSNSEGVIVSASSKAEGKNKINYINAKDFERRADSEKLSCKGVAPAEVTLRKETLKDGKRFAVEERRFYYNNTLPFNRNANNRANNVKGFNLRAPGR